jgi:3-methyladenine DNA glycosylase AlkD
MIDTSEIAAFLNLSADTEPSAQAAQGYTGSPRVHLGVGANGLRDFLSDFVAAHKSELTPEAAIPLLDSLYAGQSVEEPILAGMLLTKLPAVRAVLPFDVFERWLDRLQGWVEVDSTCQTTFGPKDLYARWEDWSAFLRKLNADPNINKRRASLVLLIRSVRESDDPRGVALALELVGNRKAERDKLITKAVSWLLREAVKRHPSEIAAYLDRNASELAPHIVREVRKKLETGKKR